MWCSIDQRNVFELAPEHGGRNGVYELTRVRKHTDGNGRAIASWRNAKLYQCASNNCGSTSRFVEGLVPSTENWNIVKRIFNFMQ
jgi:hypothetical protein